MIFNAHIFQFAQQGFHSWEDTAVIGTTAEDHSFVAENIVDDIRRMCLRSVVDPYLFNALFGEETSDRVRHLLRVTVHTAESDHHSFFGFVFTPFFIFSDDITHM